jgi:uncharacterized protein (UPF0332 family)
MMGEPSFDWLRYLQLAEDLATQKNEAAFRSAISRAYYCVYHLALSRAKANGYEPIRNEPQHAQLWELFVRNPDAACIRLGELGSRLRDIRARADYSDLFLRIEEEVEEVIRDAKSFAANLTDLAARLPSPRSVRR